MKPKALVVEDTEDVAQVFHTAMDEAGYDSETIYDGTLAIKRLGEIVPDLVVLDLHLPGMSGEQVLNYIQADSRFDKTNVILATADASWAQKFQGETTITMLKPISFTQLRQLAERLKP